MKRADRTEWICKESFIQYSSYISVRSLKQYQMMKHVTYTDIPEHGWAIYRRCRQHGSLWRKSDACHTIFVASQRRVGHFHIPFTSAPNPYSDGFISGTQILCRRGPIFTLDEALRRPTVNMAAWFNGWVWDHYTSVSIQMSFLCII